MTSPAPHTEGLAGGLPPGWAAAPLASPPGAAAVWAVHLHAVAGAAAASRPRPDGLPASDVVEWLLGVLRAARRQAAAI